MEYPKMMKMKEINKSVKDFTETTEKQLKQLNFLAHRLNRVRNLYKKRIKLILNKLFIWPYSVTLQINIECWKWNLLYYVLVDFFDHVTEIQQASMVLTCNRLTKIKWKEPDPIILREWRRL